MKTKVGVFFGGASVEHEISVITANQVLHGLDKSKYDVIPVYLSKDNIMYTGSELFDLQNYSDLENLKKKLIKVNFVQIDGSCKLVKVKPTKFSKKNVSAIDIVFPTLHGGVGENGSFVGMLEVLGVPFVGSGVLGGALGQDKVVMKQVLSANGLPVVDYRWFYRDNWFLDQDSVLAKVMELSFPLVVKPCSLGSSISVFRVENLEELKTAVDEACVYDEKIIVEKAVVNLQEVNCAALGDSGIVETSAVEEVFGESAVLSFEDKYEGNGAKDGSKGMASTKRAIPANISLELTNQIKDLTARTFNVLNSSGVARVDFLIDKLNEDVFVNEINTVPGSLSFYLWENKGKSFSSLLNELIVLGVKRSRRRKQTQVSINTEILKNLADNGGVNYKK